MRKFAPANQGHAVGPVSPAQAATSGKGGEVLVVGTGVTVPSGSPYAGTYDLSAVDSSDGPVFLKAPGHTGTLGTGNTLTGVNGLAVGSVEDGAVALSDFSWVPAAGNTTSGPTRVQAGTDALGLKIRQTAFNAAGLRLAEAEVIASPIFSEQRLTGGRLYLDGGAGRDQASAPITKMIVVTSYIWRAGSTGNIFESRNPLNGNFDEQLTTVGHTATNWRPHRFNLFKAGSYSNAANFTTESTITLTDGDRLDILSCLEVASQTAVLGANSARSAYRVNGGAWIEVGTNFAKSADSAETLPGDAWRIGASQQAQTATLGHELIRFAMWFDQAADPHDADVRSRFFADVTVQPIELASFFYGEPVVRFDTLTAVQSGTNQGTLASVWASEGTWVDAS